MIYVYKALNKNGREIAGEIEAGSLGQAKSSLKSQGLYLKNIRESKAVSSVGESSSGDNFLYKLNNVFVRIGAKDRALFARQLGTLLRAGMELATALTDIAEQTENENFRRIIWDLKEKIVEGASLSRAMSQHPRAFGDIFVYMIRAGESLGKLDDILIRLAELEEKNNRLRNKIQAAMMYPMFMMVMMVVVISVLMSRVVPEITKVFTKSNAVLPLPTKIVIFVSDIMANYWFLLIALAILAIYLLRRYLASEAGKSAWDNFKRKNRISRSLYGKVLSSRFTRNMGILLNSKVDLIDSLDIVKKIVQNVHVEKALEEVREEVKSGASLARSIKEKNIFPRMVVGMIAAGEASDRLDDMLVKIAEIYEEDVESAISSFMALLEPLIIVVMAVSVGFVVLSIILPITQMNQLIK